MHAAAWFDPNVFAISFLGIAGSSLGTLLIGAQSNWHKRLWATLAGGFTLAAALFAAAGYSRGQAPAIWIPPLVLAVVGFASFAPRLAYVKLLGSGLKRVAQNRAVHWGLLILAGPCAGFAWAMQSDRDDDFLAPPVAIDIFDRSNLREFTPSPAFTDAGAPVRVYFLPEGGQVEQSLTEREKAFLEKPAFAQRIIRLSGPDTGTNCFGWVFAEGRFWIRQPECIEAILKDNGYHSVSAPEVGDLVLYRNSDSKPSHVGVVRVVDQDGPVLLESKWGVLGRFFHAPENQPYSNNWTYYRSSRGSHVLNGIDSAGPNISEATSAAH